MTAKTIYSSSSPQSNSPPSSPQSKSQTSSSACKSTECTKLEEQLKVFVTKTDAIKDGSLVVSKPKHLSEIGEVHHIHKPATIKHESQMDWALRMRLIGTFEEELKKLELEDPIVLYQVKQKIRELRMNQEDLVKVQMRVDFYVFCIKAAMVLDQACVDKELRNLNKEDYSFMLSDKFLEINKQEDQEFRNLIQTTNLDKMTKGLDDLLGDKSKNIESSLRSLALKSITRAEVRSYTACNASSLNDKLRYLEEISRSEHLKAQEDRQKELRDLQKARKEGKTVKSVVLGLEEARRKEEEARKRDLKEKKNQDLFLALLNNNIDDLNLALNKFNFNESEDLTEVILLLNRMDAGFSDRTTFMHLFYKLWEMTKGDCNILKEMFTSIIYNNNDGQNIFNHFFFLDVLSGNHPEFANNILDLANKEGFLLPLLNESFKFLASYDPNSYSKEFYENLFEIIAKVIEVDGLDFKYLIEFLQKITNEQVLSVVAECMQDFCQKISRHQEDQISENNIRQVVLLMQALGTLLIDSQKSKASKKIAKLKDLFGEVIDKTLDQFQPLVKKIADKTLSRLEKLVDELRSELKEQKGPFLEEQALEDQALEDQASSSLGEAYSLDPGKLDTLNDWTCDPEKSLLLSPQVQILEEPCLENLAANQVCLVNKQKNLKLFNSLLQETATDPLELQFLHDMSELDVNGFYLRVVSYNQEYLSALLALFKRMDFTRVNPMPQDLANFFAEFLALSEGNFEGDYFLVALSKLICYNSEEGDFIINAPLCCSLLNSRFATHPFVLRFCNYVIHKSGFDFVGVPILFYGIFDEIDDSLTEVFYKNLFEALSQLISKDLLMLDFSKLKQAISKIQNPELAKFCLFKTFELCKLIKIQRRLDKNIKELYELMENLLVKASYLDYLELLGKFIELYNNEQATQKCFCVNVMVEIFLSNIDYLANYCSDVFKDRALLSIFDERNDLRNNIICQLLNVIKEDKTLLSILCTCIIRKINKLQLDHNHKIDLSRLNKLLEILQTLIIDDDRFDLLKEETVWKVLFDLPAEHFEVFILCFKYVYIHQESRSLALFAELANNMKVVADPKGSTLEFTGEQNFRCFTNFLKLLSSLSGEMCVKFFVGCTHDAVFETNSLANVNNESMTALYLKLVDILNCIDDQSQRKNLLTLCVIPGQENSLLNCLKTHVENTCDWKA